MKEMKLLNGEGLPRIGQGTWFMGERPADERDEIAALRRGAELGLTLIDTAEMYGEGASEALVGKAIAPLERERLFVVSKVYPHNAGRERMQRHCEASLKRLGLETLDLYLLHWRGRVPLAETVECMEVLRRQGKIRYWGVSNLDADDMRELCACAGGADCGADQVLYHLGSRGVEYELLPYLAQRGMLAMAYCPLAQAGSLRRGLLQNEKVLAVARKHGISAMQALLGFMMRAPGVLPIPKAARAEHVAQNAAMLHIALDDEDMAALDAAYPPPKRKVALDIV